MEKDKQESVTALAGIKREQASVQFPVNSIDAMLDQIRRVGGTGKLEINFRNGYARGEAKWKGYVKPDE